MFFSQTRKKGSDVGQHIGKGLKEGKKNQKLLAKLEDNSKNGLLFNTLYYGVCVLLLLLL